MNAEKKKAVRNRNWVEISVIDDAQKRLGLNDADLGRALGYSSGHVVGKWRETGLAPATAGLAAEALVRRAGPTAKHEDSVIVAVVRDGRVLTAKVYNGLGEIKLNNQSYLLVPSPK